MNDLKGTKTDDLIAELLELENNAKADPASLEDVYARIPKAKRHSQICYELDSRLDKAGITMYENQFIYTKADAWTALDRVGEEYIALAADLPAKEQHDLETWLLIKKTA